MTEDDRDPEIGRQTLELLAPLNRELRRMQRGCRPFGAEYDAVAISLAAVDESAEELTGERGHFAAHGDASGPMLPN